MGVKRNRGPVRPLFISILCFVAPFQRLPTPLDPCSTKICSNEHLKNKAISRGLLVTLKETLPLEGHSARGVTRLYGSRGKKQVWHPMFETEVFRKLMHCIEESACDIVGTFRRSAQSFGAHAVIRRPGNCAPPCPPCYDLHRAPVEKPWKSQRRSFIFQPTRIFFRSTWNFVEFRWSQVYFFNLADAELIRSQTMMVCPPVTSAIHGVSNKGGSGFVQRTYFTKLKRSTLAINKFVVRT